MNYFLISILGNFLPAALLLGLNWVRRPAVSPRRLALVSILAVAMGVVAGRTFPTSPTVLLAVSITQMTLLLAFALSQFNRSAWLGYTWQGILLAVGGFRWGLDRNLGAISATSVVNTDLLLNLSAVAFGVILLVVLTMGIVALIRQQPALHWLSVIIVVVLLLIPLGGECALALIKLKAVNLTASHLSFSARATDFGTRLPYILPLLILGVIAWSVWKVILPRRASCGVENPIERRLALSSYRYAYRLAAGLFVAVLLVLGTQWHWDHVASQPPTLSKTTRLVLGEDDQLHIPLAIFRDNDLHRFDWVAEDGKVVRFFALNRYADRPSVTAVFDSCMLCGDKGYALRDGQVVCIACGVRLFLPSVGNQGGCNPIPMVGWKVVGDELVIPRSTLESGVNYFTTVVTKQVVDPVNGEILVSAKAKHSYEYGGRTYYFTTEKSYESFVAEPQKYTGKKKSCCGGS